jgi:hypothetical protein
MPKALSEYNKGWDGWSGTIPTGRKGQMDMYPAREQNLYMIEMTG